jgi:uncharacterized glyoxalase superfamily protein PhnB
MPSFAKPTTSNLIPCLSYRNASAAVEWLSANFGFEKSGVFTNDAGKVEHAQLRFGNSMIMIGPKRDSPYGRLIKQPDEIGNCETQTVYAIVTDADAIYSQAKAAGAEILLDIKDEDYGGRGFTCRDLEGHIWNFGTYDPWQAK